MTPVDLKGLSAVARKLNEQTDALNKTILDLDAKLAEMNLGVSVWTGEILGQKDTIEKRPAGQHWREGEEDVRVRRGWELGYARVGEGWVIAVRQVEGLGPDFDHLEWSDDEPTALASSPRAVRVEAAEHLEGLIDSIKERAEEFIANIEGAKALLK